MPRMLDLIGIKEILEDSIDGMSVRRLLFADEPENQTFGFRQYFLNEYKSVGTYFNDHGTIWQDGTSASDRCQTGPDSDSRPVGPDPNTSDEDCIKLQDFTVKVMLRRKTPSY